MDDHSRYTIKTVFRINPRFAQNSQETFYRTINKGMTSTTAQNVAQAKPQVKTTTSYLLCLKNYESLLRF